MIARDPQSPATAAATAAAPLIGVDGVTFEYPGRRALDGVSFTLGRGSVTALVGPNGAGKTTLLRCLAGLDRPLGGSIIVAGIDVVAEPRRSHRAMGYLSDFFGLYDELSVRQCLDYVARANSTDAAGAATRVARTAAILGLEQRLDQRAGSLSRGLRQRVAIGQAIIHDPAVVLLDEPAAGLDPEARYELGELFRDLGRRGMTLVVSSHILAELEAYSTDMLVMRDGRVIDHRRLAAPNAPGTRLRIAATAAGAALLRVLGDDERVSELQQDGDAIECRFDGGADARAGLLAALVGAGVGVHEFVSVREDLQQSYLRSIHETDDGGDRGGDGNQP